MLCVHAVSVQIETPKRPLHLVSNLHNSEERDATLVNDTYITLCARKTSAVH